MQTYEVEVKSLLGSSERAQAVRDGLEALGAGEMIANNKQLNHYFEGGDLVQLAEIFSPSFPERTREQFLDLVKRAKTYSVRTRDKNGELFLVIKASVDETTSENGIKRMELENKMDPSSGINTIEKLDKLVLASGFKYQAKWSREREEYEAEGTNVTIDRNAGYGYLAEFERMVEDPAQLDGARAEINTLMAKLGVEELPQERLERMFAYYNAHWQDYYGTDKIFTIE